MATGARAHVLAAASARRAFAWAPDWRALFAGAWRARSRSGGSSCGFRSRRWPGSALNFAADQEPSLWLPALLTAAFAALAWAARARPVTRGLLIGAAALCAGFLSTGLRIARVETPMLDHIRIVKLQGFVEEIDFRPVGARLVLAVVDHGDMPADLAPRRVRVTTRKTPERLGRRLRRAAGAAAAAVARGPAGRLRLCPRRLFRRRRRGRLDARRHLAFCRRRSTRPGASGSARRSITPAIAWPCASTRSSAATRARSPRRW